MNTCPLSFMVILVKATHTEPRDFIHSSQHVSKEGLEQRVMLHATSRGSRNRTLTAKQAHRSFTGWMRSLVCILMGKAILGHLGPTFSSEVGCLPSTCPFPSHPGSDGSPNMFVLLSIPWTESLSQLSTAIFLCV